MSLAGIQSRFVDLLFEPKGVPQPSDPLRGKIEIHRRLVIARNGRVLDAVYRDTIDEIEASGLATRTALYLGFLAESPPRGHWPEELSDRFLAWLESRRRTLLDAIPGLRGRLHDRRLEHEVLHAEDEGCSEPLGTSRVAALADGRGRRDLRLRLASWVRVPSCLSGTDEKRICTRDADGCPGWLRLEPGPMRIVSALSPGGTLLRLDRLAESWLASGCGPGTDGDAGFWSDLAVLAGARALIGE